jgi:preprotein translocase subunit SecA
MFSFLNRFFDSKHDKDVAKYSPKVALINEEGERLKKVSNDELRNRSLEFKERIKAYLSDIDQEIEAAKNEAHEEEDVDAKEQIFIEIDELLKERDKILEKVLLDILPEAFATVKETARRFKENSTLTVTATAHDKMLAANPKKTYISIQEEQAVWKNSWTAAGGEVTWNMVHYDVQLIGGMVLHDGKIAEMQTGEGKTLVATLPAYLNGLSGEGVNIITVNDYLARRDSEWVGPIFEFLFLTIDCIDNYRPNTEDRRKAYRCDITYGTNNEFGFDYLRDNMVISKQEMVQRKLHFAMVDEVDSVLIDDARTPLIISGPVQKDAEDQEYESLKPLVERLLAAQQKLTTQYLTDARTLFKAGKTGYVEGEAGMCLLRAYRTLPKYRPLIKFLSEEGVRVCLQKAENYYMQEQSKNMHLVDETLLFTIDEKNRNVELTDNGAEFLAKYVEDENFFIMPDMATRMNEIDEDKEMTAQQRSDAKIVLAQEYSVKARRLHATSQLLKAYTLFERDQEYVVMEGQVKIVDEQTGRMMEGRRYSDGLHQALEAKENVKIGDITQTYATVTLQNYFRMYHKLGGMTGTAETESGEFWEIYKLDVVVIPTNKKSIRADKEDMVFKTAREKYNALVDEITALTNAGRPVLVGTTSVEISEMLSRLLSFKGIAHNVLNAKQHQREAEIVAEAGKPGKVTIATNMAGRGTDIKITEEVRQAGGLAIIGTERHDSRRVDRQLRGRSGRQGDPGSSQFYVSLEDNLMRLFQSERIAKLMDRMGHKEGEVIQHSMVTKSIERAQKKVEENNFGTRKRLLEYDDVMNIQREAIYKKRRNILAGERFAVDLNNMFESIVQGLVENHKTQGSLETFRRGSIRTLGVDPNIESVDFKEGKIQDLVQRFGDQVMEQYQRKMNETIYKLLPMIKEISAREGNRYKRIIVPFTDGRKSPFLVTADIEEAILTEGKSIQSDIERTISLALIDDIWKEHLRNMDELKDSVQAASFEQKDPLVIYKMEAYQLFEELVFKINSEVTSYLSQGMLFVNEEKNLEEAKVQVKPSINPNRIKTNKTADDVPERVAAKAAAQAANELQRTKQDTYRREEKKVGRNDECPCGSGKKYKHCHGKI